MHSKNEYQVPSTKGTRGFNNNFIIELNSGNCILLHEKFMEIPWKSIACNRPRWTQLLFYTNSVPVLRRAIAFRVSIDFSKINGKAIEIPWISLYFSRHSGHLYYRYFTGTSTDTCTGSRRAGGVPN
jgi:hypothetical protein